MSELERACWYASWCFASGYKRATRKWLIDALVIQWLHREGLVEPVPASM